MIFSDALTTALCHARHITILTGAGISAESGVPTFRSNDGLWKKFRPEELANYNAFIQNPLLVTEWYNARRQIIRDVEPNDGHRALVELEQYTDSLSIITQNIDGLHQRAGSRRIIELHGNIHRNYCVDCRTEYMQENIPSESMPPTCSCGGLIRADVVWFGEMLSDTAMQNAHNEAMNCDVFMTIGTSAVVYPAAGLPLYAKEYGAYVVEINLEKTELSSAVNECIIGKAGAVLPALLDVLRKQKR